MKMSLLLITLLTSFCLCAEDVSVKPAGEGTAESPYLFDRLENFFWLRQQTSEMDPHVPVYCKQIKDIDASATQQGGDYTWQTIEFNNHIFIYDGQCYTIYGLEPEEKGYLFGNSNLQLKNIRICGTEGKKTCALAKGISSKAFLKNCHVEGLVVGTPALVENVSGSDIIIEDCVAEVDIEGLQSSGSLIKQINVSGVCSVRNTCFRGRIKTTKTGISGMIGFVMPLSNNAEFIIEDCYSAFDVAVVPEDSCQFAGLIYQICPISHKIKSKISIERCYVFGKISGSKTVNNKAFILWEMGSNSTVNVKHCFYNESMNLPDDYAVSKTDEEMKHRATFENYDFENVWDIDEGEGMPFLRCEIPEPHWFAVMLLLFLFKNRSTKIIRGKL
ncbi:hypothetical protein IJS98_05910 [bacterium]|nr:hypothetical protein [bacterium]